MICFNQPNGQTLNSVLSKDLIFPSLLEDAFSFLFYSILTTTKMKMKTKTVPQPMRISHQDSSSFMPGINSGGFIIFHLNQDDSS